MNNNKPDLSKLHNQFNELTTSVAKISEEQRNKIKFPYEVLISVDRGWIPCAILEVDTEKELAKVAFYHPDHAGWMETCQGGVFDEVVEMWRVRVRE